MDDGRRMKEDSSMDDGRRMKEDSSMDDGRWKMDEIRCLKSDVFMSHRRHGLQE